MSSPSAETLSLASSLSPSGASVLVVALALLSALLFGAMTVALRFGLRENADAKVGALVTTAVAFVLAAVAAVTVGGWSLGEAQDLAVFAAAGLLAPGGSQLLFTRAVREAGPSRTSVVVGGAPLVAAAIAITALGEPVEAGILAGGLLVVLGGFALFSERRRPEHFQAVGIAFAVGSTLLFATRDNVVRAYSDDTVVQASTAAAVALAGGATGMLAFVLLTRRRPLATASRGLRGFVAAGVLFGLSYVLLFEAYYRGRVTVVSPLVATESLWGVLLSALLVGRSELVGARLAAGALLVVSGSAIIGISR